MAPYTASKLTKALVVGLLWALPSGAASVPRQADVEAALPPVIAIKLGPGSSPSRKRQDASTAGAKLVESLVLKALPTPKLGRRNGNLKTLPLYNSLSPEAIDQIVKDAEANDPTYKAPNFHAWFQVQLPDTQTKINTLLQTLAAYPEIESCQRLGSAARPPAVQPDDDPLFPEQAYLRDASRGINAQYAWGFPGGDGAGTTLIDVESGWKLDHPDLVAANISVLSGVNNPGKGFSNLPHGTSVLGILFATDNAIGGVGVVPAARGAAVSVLRGDNPNDNNPAGILDAASRLQAGDVMLLEMQVSNAAEDEYWPAELYDAEFEAIRAATAKGIVVIEPAGNGVRGRDENGVPREGTAPVDLDGPVMRPGETEARDYLRPGSQWFRESGAIVVGASTSGVPRRRTVWSNFGGRVDVHAWGENITTTGCEPGFNGCVDRYETFGGTSGASPIVAGAALSVQGMLSAKGRGKLNSVEMRELLQRGGSNVGAGTGNIGVMPDLKALIDCLFYS
ncbi:peptidase S8/S53 domain-containing protein [Podospora conica]|nr:peptidase S8/S53 domain-containing protein [Schizothecium conicum]